MKIVMKAVDREFPDNVGTYLYRSYLRAAKQLGVELIRLPSADFYTPGKDIKEAARQEVRWINNQDADAFIFFSAWIGGASYRHVSQAYRSINCKTVFISREDPNHFDMFLSDTKHADVIATCASECVPKYQAAHPDKKVICIPMAVDPEMFFCDREFNARGWDIVFLGNRYVKRDLRNDAEEAVIKAAIEFSNNNVLQMGIFGHTDGVFGWNNVPEALPYAHSRVDRITAGVLYGNSKIALSVASNNDSPTMAPNRIPQIAAAGCICINYNSPATDWMLDGNNNSTDSATQTKILLEDIFSNPDKYFQKAEAAQEHVLRNHTFKNRLELLINTIEEVIR